MQTSTQATQPRTEVVGWGATGAPWAAPEAWSASRTIAQALHDMGVRDTFGVLGGGIAPFAAGLARSALSFYHFRHEAGAGFAAVEAHFATGRPTAVVVTTGPGLFNVLCAAMAARTDGAKLVVISGFTSRLQSGRGAVQETSAYTMPADLLRPGSLFHEVFVPESLEELPQVFARIKRGLDAPGGFVAHLALPLSLQTQLAAPPSPIRAPSQGKPAPSREDIEEILSALLDSSALLWIGHGAREASPALTRFAERALLPVVSSPRGKGIFPENHPLFVGVSGAGCSANVRKYFAERSPSCALVVGTRLGEVTSFLSPACVPSRGFFHVDIDPSAFGAAFPAAETRGIVADAQQLFEALDARASAIGWYERRALGATPLAALPRPARLEPRTGDVRPPFLLQTLQERIVERTDLIVMSEAGASFTWCNALLSFDRPDRYRTSAAWGSMGHFTTGCVGASLCGRRALSVVGDGAMLMNNEINTAVQYGARAIWVVLNDAQLGLNEHGMTALGMKPVETQLPRTDFVAFARSQGADGAHVRSEHELAAALEAALDAQGPFVVDVCIDRSVPSPVVAERIASLRRQAGGGR